MNMDSANGNGKVKIRENHDMGFHKAMKFGIMELLTAAVGLSVYKLFALKGEYSDGMSGPLKLLTNFGSVLEIIIVLLGIATVVGFFMEKKFCVFTVKAFCVLLVIDRLMSFILISVCDEASLITTDNFLPAYALWNIRLTFFALIIAVVLIKYYNERKNMFN